MIDDIHPAGCGCVRCKYTSLAHQERPDRPSSDGTYSIAIDGIEFTASSLHDSETDDALTSRRVLQWLVGKSADSLEEMADEVDRLRHALSVVSDMIRGGDTDRAVAHIEAVLADEEVADG